MRNIVFAAPFFGQGTIKFLDAVTCLPDVRTSLISQDPAHRLPDRIKNRIFANYQVRDGLDAQQLADGTRWLGSKMGNVDRLLGTLEQLQEPLGDVRDALGIEGLGGDAARNFRDKSRMKDKLRAAGLPCAKSRLLMSPKSAWDFAQDVGFPFVIKPPAGAGAIGTFKIGGAVELQDVLGRISIGPTTPVLAEEFVRGEENSLEIVSIKGRAVWFSGTRYLPAPLEVLENSWIQWCVLMPRETDNPCDTHVVNLGAEALKVLGMHTGISHMEWFRRPDGSLAISEIGARPPGANIMTINSVAHDIDMNRAWAELVVFDRFAAPERRYAAGAAFLRGQGQGAHIKAVHGVEWAKSHLGHLMVEAKLPHQGQGRSSSYEGDGYIILRHRETGVVQSALKDLVSSVRIDVG